MERRERCSDRSCQRRRKKRSSLLHCQEWGLYELSHELICSSLWPINSEDRQRREEAGAEKFLGHNIGIRAKFESPGVTGAISAARKPISNSDQSEVLKMAFEHTTRFVRREAPAPNCVKIGHTSGKSAGRVGRVEGTRLLPLARVWCVGSDAPNFRRRVRARPASDFDAFGAGASSRRDESGGCSNAIFEHFGFGQNSKSASVSPPKSLRDSPAIERADELMAELIQPPFLTMEEGASLRLLSAPLTERLPRKICKDSIRDILPLIQWATHFHTEVPAPSHLGALLPLTGVLCKRLVSARRACRCASTLSLSSELLHGHPAAVAPSRVWPDFRTYPKASLCAPVPLWILQVHPSGTPARCFACLCATVASSSIHLANTTGTYVGQQLSLSGHSPSVGIAFRLPFSCSFSCFPWKL
ncbi:hypothetical protein Acr_07g0002220 [Actinidia rufa]|uniref:Uncharacterized protein n=1 Tax=Actinidia rufa TaxID=165716 RepID=A0A7J0EU50_9ERIC|nr:hypothetical protein Acr_07g0002220 [Actinidia rufa]